MKLFALTALAVALCIADASACPTQAASRSVSRAVSIVRPERLTLAERIAVRRASRGSRSVSIARSVSVAPRQTPEVVIERAAPRASRAAPQGGGASAAASSSGAAASAN